jgi:hypothetical protein
MSAATAPDDVEHLLADHPPAVVAATLHLRDLLRTAHPELHERLRTGWHSLNYRHPQAGYVCGLFPRDAGVALVFERGAQLPDPDGLLRGNGRTVRSLEFSSPPGPGADDVVLEFVHQAITLGRRSGPR